jgi:hypothetical protein
MECNSENLVWDGRHAGFQICSEQNLADIREKNLAEIREKTEHFLNLR